jgi:hypothetical protein
VYVGVEVGGEKKKVERKRYGVREDWRYPVVYLGSAEVRRYEWAAGRRAMCPCYRWRGQKRSVSK